MRYLQLVLLILLTACSAKITHDKEYNHSVHSGYSILKSKADKVKNKHSIFLPSYSESGVFTDLSDVSIQPESISFSPKGHRLWFLGSDGNSIYEATLSQPYNIEGMQLQTEFQTNLAPVKCFRWSNDGNTFHVLTSYPDSTLYQYTVQEAYNINTLSLNSSHSFENYEGYVNTRGFEFSPDGSKLFVVNVTSHIYQYSTNMFDVNTLSLQSVLSISDLVPELRVNTQEIRWIEPKKFMLVTVLNDKTFQIFSTTNDYDLNGTQPDADNYLSLSGHSIRGFDLTKKNEIVFTSRTLPGLVHMDFVRNF